MNPRYLAYCAAHQRTPDAMLAYDAERYPGGAMCGFILWMSDQWRDFEATHPLGLWERDRALLRLLHADAFDVWLQLQRDVK